MNIGRSRTQYSVRASWRIASRYPDSGFRMRTAYATHGSSSCWETTKQQGGRPSTRVRYARTSLIMYSWLLWILWHWQWWHRSLSRRPRYTVHAGPGLAATRVTRLPPRTEAQKPEVVGYPYPCLPRSRCSGVWRLAPGHKVSACRRRNFPRALVHMHAWPGVRTVP